MHVLHQGVASVVIAAVLCDHLESKHPDISLKHMDELLHGPIFEHYKTWCSQRSPMVSACSHRFILARLGKEKWANAPELSSVYKASVVKTLMFWTADYLKAERDDEVPNSDLRLFCIHSFAKFQQLVDMGGPWFSKEECDKVITYGWAALMFYQALASNDRKRSDGRMSFKITPKFHAFLEMQIYIQKTKRNPRCSGRICQSIVDICLCGICKKKYIYIYTCG